MIVRPVEPTDFAHVLAVWNPVIRDTTISFSDSEISDLELAEMVALRREKGHEFLVAVLENAVLGFATYGQFRPHSGYRRTVEHTVILAPEARGRGVGRALMGAIEDHARSAGHHTIYAGVSGENAAGIAFHAAVGYRQVALLPEAGWKFGRWLDLVLMVKFL